MAVEEASDIRNKGKFEAEKESFVALARAALQFWNICWSSGV